MSGPLKKVLKRGDTQKSEILSGILSQAAQLFGRPSDPPNDPDDTPNGPDGPPNGPDGPTNGPDGPSSGPDGPSNGPDGPSNGPDGPPNDPDGPPNGPDSGTGDRRLRPWYLTRGWIMSHLYL